MDVLVFKPCVVNRSNKPVKKKCDFIISHIKNIFVLQINAGAQYVYDGYETLNHERFHKITIKQELRKLLEKGYTLYDKEKTISDIEKLLSE